MDFYIFTQTAAVWIRLNSAYKGAVRYRSRRKGPGARIITWCLLLLESVGDGGGGAPMEWVYTHANSQPAVSLVDQARVRNKS